MLLNVMKQIHGFKSRLVILGNLQNESQFDPKKISSPVMNSTTTRALVAKAAINKWQTE